MLSAAALSGVHLSLGSSAARATDSEDSFTAERAALVRLIERRARENGTFLGKSKLDPRVIAAMARVPRHEFVPESLRDFAYDDRPLPIGHDQTISQPSLVAMMTDLLELPEDCHVLEVGTGSGYQAAILGEICPSVFTIEIVEPLGRNAQALLEKLDYVNVRVRRGDGYAGWPEHAPFDAIVVTAAPPETPPPLIEQLKPGGNLVIPVGPQFSVQDLVVLTKDTDGVVSERVIFGVRFVPFTRDPAP